MSGHEHLKRHRRRHVWGIGRHLLGGQIFDYWKSPFGLIHEHWTDTDLFNEDYVDLMKHLGMEPRTIQIGKKEQNGDIEASHGALKVDYNSGKVTKRLSAN